MTPPRTRRIALPAVATMAALVLAGCADDQFESTPSDTVYCVDEQNTIVDESLCDDTSTGHSGGGSALAWFLIGRYAGGLAVGSRLHPAMSTSRFAASDAAARAAAGLSSSGRVSNGISASTGKPAGFGSGSGGSGGKPGGFGGGGDGAHGTGG